MNTENLKKKTTSTVNFVKKHRVALAVTGTATACLLLHKSALRDHDEFLAEKGLLDEFYAPDVPEIVAVIEE